jgi:hypothetical protein
MGQTVLIIESSSSRKMVDGAWYRASSKRIRTWKKIRLVKVIIMIIRIIIILRIVIRIIIIIRMVIRIIIRIRII